MADTADRVDRTVRVNNNVNRTAQRIAELPLEEQARWIVHILATLDAGADRFNEIVLCRVRDAIAARLEKPLAQIQRILAALHREGFIVRKGRRIRLAR